MHSVFHRRAACFVLLLMLGAAFPVVAHAVSDVAVVDFQRVLLESKKGQKARKEWEAEVEKRKKALEKIQNEVQELQSGFDNQAMLLSADMVEQKREEMRRKIKDAQRRATDYQEEIKRLDQKLTRDILEDVKKIVEKYSQEHKLQIVFEANTLSAVYVREGIDITDKIIALYDKS